MATPSVCVLRAPGTNCDVETAWAFETAGASAERVHLFRLIERPALLDQYQVLCIPGGFSYGDDLGAGVIFSRELRVRLGDAVGRFLQSDKLVLGICNGFQVLLKAGILPGGAASWPPADPLSATLTWNLNGRYTAVWVRLAVYPGNNVFLRGLHDIELPVAHAEGRIAVNSPGILDEWEERGQIVMRYCVRREARVPAGAAIGAGGPGERGELLPFPDNPNGSIANVAGLSDPSGRVLGMMPHPERFLHATHHPQWTRKRLTGEGTGMRIFRNAVEYFA